MDTSFGAYNFFGTANSVYIYPENIRLDEDVLKTSLVLVFKRRLQDVLIKTNIFALLIRLQKTSSRHLQDVFKTYYQLKVFLLTQFQDVFKTSSKRF